MVAVPQMTGGVSPMWLAANEKRIRERVEEIIEAHYPGHPFSVEVDLMNLMIYIDHPLVPDGRRMVVRMQDEDPEGKIFVTIAGETLERLGIPRGPFGQYSDEDYDKAAPGAKAAFESR